MADTNANLTFAAVALHQQAIRLAIYQDCGVVVPDTHHLKVADINASALDEEQDVLVLHDGETDTGLALLYCIDQQAGCFSRTMEALEYNGYAYDARCDGDGEYEVNDPLITYWRPGMSEAKRINATCAGAPLVDACQLQSLLSSACLQGTAAAAVAHVRSQLVALAYLSVPIRNYAWT